MAAMASSRWGLTRTIKATSYQLLMSHENIQSWFMKKDLAGTAVFSDAVIQQLNCISTGVLELVLIIIQLNMKNVPVEHLMASTLSQLMEAMKETSGCQTSIERTSQSQKILW